MPSDKQTVMERVLRGVAVALGKSTPKDPVPNIVRHNVLACHHIIREELLAAHYWDFAETQDELSMNPMKPLFGFNFIHNLPADFISLSYVNDNGAFRTTVGEENYDVQGRNTIKTNFNPAFISYTRNVEDETLMSPEFIKAWTLHLAAYTCFSVTKDKDREEELKKDAKAMEIKGVDISFRKIGRTKLQNRDYVETRISSGGVGIDLGVNVNPPQSEIVPPEVGGLN